MSLKHRILLTLALVSVVYAGSCPNEQNPPTGVLPKLRSMYKYGMHAWGSDAYVFWTPNVQAYTLDLALVVRGPSNQGRGPLCGWAALGYNPSGRGMVGTTAVRAFWNGTHLTQDQVFTPSYVAVTVPSQFTNGFVSTDVYGPTGAQYLISRFTMAYPNLANTSYAVFTLAARQVDSKLDFHDMFMTQTTPYVLFGLDIEGTPLGNTDYCDPSQCKDPRGKCVAPYSCICNEGWTGSQCSERNLGFYSFVKRVNPLDPRSPIKTISRFNQQIQVVSSRDIASTPSCSAGAFSSAFLSGGNVQILHPTNMDMMFVSGNKFGSVQINYDSSFTMAPTYVTRCTEVTEIPPSATIIAVSEEGVFSVQDTSKPLTTINWNQISWGRVNAQVIPIVLAAPLDLKQPFVLTAGYARASLLTQTSIQFVKQSYDGTPNTMREWKLPAAFNVSCVVARNSRDDALWVVQSCDSIPVPQVWFFGLDKNSVEASVKMVGTLGCPTGSGALDGPTLLRPEMISISRSVRVDAITNCQVGSQITPVRLVFASSNAGQVSFFQPLGLNIARSVNDLAGFNMRS